MRFKKKLYKQGSPNALNENYTGIPSCTLKMELSFLCPRYISSHYQSRYQGFLCFGYDPV